MSNRKLERRARVLALQALYAEERQAMVASESTRGVAQVGFGQAADSRFFCDVLQFSWLDQEGPPEELFLARALVEGVRQNYGEIDAIIIQHLQNWTLDRLLAVDRAILRLGVYMLKFILDMPERVIIDECIELCHSFSSEESYRLVNGMLHSVAQKFRCFESLSLGRRSLGENNETKPE